MSSFSIGSGGTRSVTFQWDLFPWLSVIVLPVARAGAEHQAIRDWLPAEGGWGWLPGGVVLRTVSFFHHRFSFQSVLSHCHSAIRLLHLHQRKEQEPFLLFLIKRSDFCSTLVSFLCNCALRCLNIWHVISVNIQNHAKKRARLSKRIHRFSIIFHLLYC
jgi:hypothetical protein